LEFLRPFPIHQQVCYLTPEQKEFEQAYLKIRALEERVYPDTLVQQLPDTPSSHRHHREWNRRKKSTQRILDFFQQQQPKMTLDLGCGNGWFTHLLASATKGEVIGVDVNSRELQQAARLFQSENCKFVYGDIFAEAWPKGFFDQIVLNSCLQYFSDLSLLLEQLFSLLTSKGKIHIVDSPVYEAEEISAARERSRIYYKSQEVEEMINSYHHHSWEDFKPYAPKVNYQPNSLIHKIKRKIDPFESPFPWIILVKPTPQYG